MAKLKQRPPLAQLVETFFGGRPPEHYDIGIVREAMVRQIINCHAMIANEYREVLDLQGLDLDPSESHRDEAYERATHLATTITMMMGALMPPPPEENIKRHALKIEVERRPAAPELREGSLPPRWPHEAFCGDDGTFDADLFSALQKDPYWDINRARREFGHGPWQGLPYV